METSEVRETLPKYLNARSLSELMDLLHDKDIGRPITDRKRIWSALRAARFT